jgi:Ca2+-binding RTX toxin-like protein
MDLAHADLNLDGNQDIISTYFRYPQDVNPIEIRISLGDGRGRFTESTVLLVAGDVPGTVHPREVVVADFNGDGMPDIFVADHGYDAAPFPGQQNLLLLSVGIGLYADSTNDLPALSDFSHAAASADIDNDGDLDIYVSNVWGQGMVPPYFLINDGAGVFTRSDTNIPSPHDNLDAAKYTSCEMADVDDDADMDLILGSSGDFGTASTILFNDGAGAFGDAIELPAKPFGDGSIAVDIDVTDINRDGRKDIFITYTDDDPFYTGRYVQVLMQDESGAFVDETAGRLPQSTSNENTWQIWTDLVDIDGDGDLDLIGHRQGPEGALAIYTNAGAGVFTLQAETLSRSWVDFELVDVNNDRLPDIVMDLPSSATTRVLEICLNVSRNGNDFLTGSGNGEEMIGGKGNDQIDAGAGDDSLYGGAGNDILIGGIGVDSMIGGTGKDIYFVDDLGDVVVETSTLANEKDSINSNVDFSLGSNLETLLLTGTADIDGTGNALKNTITGNSGANMLDGAGGMDTLKGGLGDDTYVIDLLLSGTRVKLEDRLTELAGEGTDNLMLRTSGDLGLAAPATLTLGANLENLDASGTGTNKLNLTGNAANNTITGNAGDNTIKGGGGSDSFTGGAGADRFIIDRVTSLVAQIGDFEAGTDTLGLGQKSYAALFSSGVLKDNVFDNGAAATTATQRLFYNAVTGGLWYDSDGTGAAGAVQVATLTNTPASLSASDFVLAMGN